jgi:hypothetical protein
MYDEWTHTDPILEGPLSGSNTLFVEIVQAIQKHSKQSSDSNKSVLVIENPSVSTSRPMVSQNLIKIARSFNPF